MTAGGRLARWGHGSMSDLMKGAHDGSMGHRIERSDFRKALENQDKQHGLRGRPMATYDGGMVLQQKSSFAAPVNYGGTTPEEVARLASSPRSSKCSVRPRTAPRAPVLGVTHSSSQLFEIPGDDWQAFRLLDSLPAK